MSYQLNVCHPEDIKPSIITFLANCSLIPIIGSGFSCKVPAKRGAVPTGAEYKNYMYTTLVESGKFSPEEVDQLKTMGFSSLCDYYEDDDIIPSSDRFNFLKNNFYSAKFSDSDVRRKFFEIEWPYIYSLNIDDAIENSSDYSTIILPNREFREELFNEEKCLVKLHGDIQEIVRYTKSSKIFTSKEYALSFEYNAWILNKLKNDYKHQNILFIGCSLDDETDLKALTTIPVSYQSKDNLSRTLLFTIGTPGIMQQSKYKQYGITDVVCFDDFDSMYCFLSDAWSEAQQIGQKDLLEYSRLTFCNIKGSEKDVNQNYFFWGKGLFDSKTRTISYPYHFISRDLSQQILANLSNNNVHIIRGGHVSGKSYLLADLYKSIRDRSVYLFDGRTRLSDAALNMLLSEKACVALFDVGSLNRDQFERILLDAKKVHENRSNFIINVNRNDGDTLGIVKWKLRQGIILPNDIVQYNLDSKLSEDGIAKEIPTINALLPIVNLPPYNSDRTMLDQLIYAETQMNIKGRYTRHHIVIRNHKQLALLIIFAIKEKMFSSEVINFSLEEELVDALKKYSPFIEKTESLDYEKDAVDMSSVKYVLNSKYWLQRELGEYARDNRNTQIIADAYKYIIQKVLESAGSDEFKQRRLCRNYILFDVMNDIFLNKHKGNLKLIVHIYTNLHESLARDFNFLHQKAKCYLNYAYILSNADEKLEYLEEARELAAVAASMAEDRFERFKNDNLLISLSHIQYTIATILSEMCGMQEYSDANALETTIDAIENALNSPYNVDDYVRDKRSKASHGIISFFKAATTINSAGISEEHQHKFKVLLNKQFC